METIENTNQDILQVVPKSNVKLIKNTKGINWEIKIVQGEELLIDGLMLKAVDIHKKLEKEFLQNEN